MEKLYEFCQNELQRKTLDAVIKYKSNTKAAQKMGRNRRCVDKMMQRIRERANVFYSPGFSLKGQSILWKGDKEVMHWDKTERSQENDQDLIDAVLDTFEDYKGTAKLIKAPRIANRNFLNVIPMGDPHMGLLAWADETGSDNFDCKIAEAELTKAVSQLIAIAPSAETCLLLNLGDFFHSDNHKNQTKSGNILDVDGRYGKILSIGVRVMIECIELALQQHKKVIVKNCIGNHDDHTSLALAVALDCFFSKNKRVQVDTSANKFWYYKFGNNLLGTTHGDTCKFDKLPVIMATDKPTEWGQTQHRYWWTGHIHHDSTKDIGGVECNSVRTLAARDAWHSAAGYRSQRDMKLITYHKDYGEHSRQVMSIDRIRGVK